MSLKRLLFPAILGAGAVATVLGAVALIDFESAPGRLSRPPVRWPKSSKLSRAEGRPQLVVFAHPQCACTAATLDELSAISQVSVAILFVRPGPQDEWAETGSWFQALQVKNASVSWDDGAREARLFGVATSGSVVLYGAKGDLLFHGGITSSRGHAGPSLALESLERAIRTGKPETRQSPVFGCALISAMGDRGENQ